MSRCIQCTRCVRFGQEIAGIMELGLAGRGENAEIVSFVGRAVESELSGNMIDLCPVGALTSEPFRYKARTWELSRRSISPHDSLGSNLVVQVKQNTVMRVLPLENEAINECWLSDKDRFSYDGLNSPDRLQRPMVKRDGKWHELDWEQAFDFLPRLQEPISACSPRRIPPWKSCSCARSSGLRISACATATFPPTASAPAFRGSACRSPSSRSSTACSSSARSCARTIR